MAGQKTITWRNGSLELVFLIDAEQCVRVRSLRPDTESHFPSSSYPVNSALPLVELRLAGEGTRQHKSSKSLVGSYVGTQLKYKEHHERVEGTTKFLDIITSDPKSKITVTTHLSSYLDIPVIRSSTMIQNDSDQPITVLELCSLVVGNLTCSSKEWWKDYQVSTATNSWFREAQWVDRSLPSVAVDNYGNRNEGHTASLSHFAVSNHGTFSTEGHLPMGMLKRIDGKETWLWQVENNGSWRWEIGDFGDNVYFAASGPIDKDHQWRKIINPGASFTSVPAALCRVEGGVDAAFSALTQYRRAIRRKHSDNVHLPVIFNDYMNCLMGDPTEEKVAALIQPVSRAGAEYFVIDCGWYADDSGWWDDVGEWEESKRRFPSGLQTLLKKIKASGMVPGLWVEPEVVGIRNRLADIYPPEAFFQRSGQRVVEKGRYQLDYRHPAVIERMTSIVDRLVTEYGAGYFKFDYNIDVTQGTDVDCSGPGDGQLEHNRAYLRWISSLFDRYPDLIIENCSSGAQRMDYAMLALHPIQSTSDQQDPVRYAAISAALPTAVTPEQSASWAYPQPGWDDEKNAITVLNSLLGRVHLSGRLDLVSEHQLKLVIQGMDVYKSIRADLSNGTPFWPLGLPGWHDDWLSVGIKYQDKCYLSVWRRGGEESCSLPISHLQRSQNAQVSLLFPKGFPVEANWDSAEGCLLANLPTVPSGRLFCLEAPLTNGAR